MRNTTGQGEGQGARPVSLSHLGRGHFAQAQLELRDGRRSASGSQLVFAFVLGHPLLDLFKKLDGVLWGCKEGTGAIG